MNAAPSKIWTGVANSISFAEKLQIVVAVVAVVIANEEAEEEEEEDIQ